MNYQIELCKSCGQPYDKNEVNDGYCLECTPDAGAILSIEEPPQVEWVDMTGDCV